MEQQKVKQKRELTLEEEIKLIVSQNPKQVTELIKTWLNE